MRALGPAGRKVGVEQLLLANFRLARLVRKIGERGPLEALGELALSMDPGFRVRKALILPMRSAAISPLERVASGRLDACGCRRRLFLDRSTRG